MDFESGFKTLTNFMPMKWQSRLFADYFTLGKIPAAVDIPTGLGKTSIIAIWYLALKEGACLPRRLVYVVDRRAVVDQATEEAEKIKAHARDESLKISTLRGQYADKGDWLRDPAASAIIVGTVDMIGSRLLFAGYGVTRKMRPYHAGLLGVDTLVVLDELHLVPPFEKLLQQIEGSGDLGPKDEHNREIVPPFRLLPLSATGKAVGKSTFRLTKMDRKDPVAVQRLEAVKELKFKPLGEAKLEDRLADEAWKLAGDGASILRVLIYCNSRDVAGRVKDNLAKKAKSESVDIENPELFVGARRVYEREIAKKRLADLGFLSGSTAPLKPAFVIATSAGEVGVDLDAEHMVMDLVPFERMVQRLGRVNRLGEKNAKIAVIDDPPKPPKTNAKKAEKDKHEDELTLYRARKAALELLPSIDNKCFDASPGAFLKLREDEYRKTVLMAATTPDPLYPALTRALADAWSMTSLKEHTGRPEVQPWLRGWVEDEPQSTLVWRTWLPIRIDGGEATEKEINEFFAAASPHLVEKLETESYRVHGWLKKRLKKFLDGADKAEIADERKGFGAERPLRKSDVVCFLLGRANEQKRPFTLSELVEASANKVRFVRSVAGMTLVLDARIGGLSDDGLLDDKSDATVRTADAENGWFNPKTEKPFTPFRVRRVRVRVDDEGEAADPASPEVAAGGDEIATGEDWKAIHGFDTERTQEGEAVWRLDVDKWYEENPDENARAITRKAQLLSEHQEWAADKAEEIVKALELKSDIGNAIVLATRLHDEGKRTQRWQRAFSAPLTGKVYAKTKGPFRQSVLGGYRHEFGSLLEAEKRGSLASVSGEMQDLVLHLITAHHGRARPVIETDGAEEPPSLLEARACEVALRFARLQKRYSPWGLAWLEAILRAADQQASRDLDEGRNPNG